MLDFKRMYNLSDEFPREQFYRRESGGSVQSKVSFMSRSVFDLLRLNSHKLKVVHAGVKAFSSHSQARNLINAASNGE